MPSGAATVTPPPSASVPSSDTEPSPYRPLLVLAAVALLIAFTAYYGFQRLERLIERDKLAEMGAVADMKADQIAAWRNNHKRLGEAFAHDSVLSAEFGLWLQNGMRVNERLQRLQKMLAEMQSVNGYESIFLLDRGGRVRLSTDGTSALGEEHVRQALQSMDSREVVFVDFHRNSHGVQGISIDLIVPLTVVENGTDRAIGAAVMQIDPYEFLYPLIQSWPTRSLSAETQLVRQEGGNVLYLNELRHQKDTALALHIPLATPNLVAAMAVRGEVSTADGVDYRGIPVVSEMRRIPGTSWFVVSKMDREELFAPIYQLRAWSMWLVMTFVAIGGLLAFVWLRGYRMQFRYLQMQRDAAVEREMLTKHFEYLTKYANDIIMLSDEKGNIVEANERAVQTYGYTREELLRMHVTDFRDPDTDPALFRRQLDEIMQRGELRYELVHERKDGTTFPVEVSARVIDVDGIRYLQGIARDISERRRAEEALRKSETLLREAQQMAHIGTWELDLVANVLYWTDENYRIFEIDRERFGVSYEAFLSIVHPDDRAWVDGAYTDSVKNRTPYVMVHRLLFPDGRVKYVQERCETFYDAAGKPLRSIGTTQDITVQQLAQNALRQSADEIADLYENAPCGYHSLDGDGKIVRINDTELTWLGYGRDEVVGKMSFADLLTPDSLQLFRNNYAGFKERGYVHDLEYELIRKDGTTLPVMLSATALYGSDGRYLMSRSTLFDVTARKRAEEELRLHGALLAQMEEGVILVRADNATIVFVNPKLEKMFGYAPGEMNGMHVSRLNAPEAKNPEETAAEIIEALKDKGQWSGEIANRRKDGTVFWCRANVSTFQHRSYGTVWVSTHGEITERKRTEELIRRNNQLLETVFSSVHVMIAYLDRDFNFIKVNRAYAAAEQQTPEFFPGKNHFDLFPNEENEAIFRKAVETGEPVIHYAKPFEYAEHPERGVSYWDWRLEPIKGGDGRVEGLIFSLLNVTEQAVAVQAIKAASQYARSLIEASLDPLVTISAEGKITDVNQATETVTGRNRAELIGTDFSDYFTEPDKARAGYQQMFREGAVTDYPLALRHRDGDLTDVLYNASVYRDEAGKALGVFAAARDVTERKLVEKKLGESEERFRSMADNAPIMIWMAHVQEGLACCPGNLATDLVGCNYFNQRWYEFTGLPVERAASCRWHDILHLDDKKHCLEVYTDAFQRRQSFKVEYRLRYHDGTFRWVEDAGVPRFAADGQYLGFIGTCSDLTERKLFETLRSEMEHMDRLNIAGEMASGLAHELSQPLTAANNYLDGCLRRMADGNWDRAALQNTVRLAHGQTERAGKIIGHLKDIVRKQKYDRTLLDLNAVVKDSIRFLEYELQRHNVSAALDLSQLPPVVANRIELEQVLINLIKNAIDSMSSSPRRELRIATRIIGTDDVLVIVSDTGRGLAAEDVERIFDPFQTSKQDGLGLGLAICRSLIEGYGGKIWAERKEGAGMEFNFTLTSEAVYE